MHVPSSVQYCAKVMQVNFAELRDLRLVLFSRNVAVGGIGGREGEREREKEVVGGGGGVWGGCWGGGGR